MKDYLGILTRHKRPTRFLAGRLLVKSRGCHAFTIKQNGYRLRFYPSNLSESLWVDPSWREPDLLFFREYLKPGNKVVDVGANIGDTALTSAVAVGEDGFIWAIEPHPRTYGFLLGNIALNNRYNIQAINCAVGAAKCDLVLSDDRRDDMNRVGTTGIKVCSDSLDNIIEYRECIDLLKIDVEGYELYVLKGAREILRQTLCIYFEVCERHFQDFGYQIVEMLDMLTKFGYVIVKHDRRVIEKIHCSYSTAGVENLIAVRNIGDLLRRTGWTLK